MHNLMWLRNDLRTVDNPALQHALKTNSAGTIAIFIITLQQWQTHGWGANKTGFVLNNLLSLQQELASLNVPLLLLECDTFNQVPALLLKISHEYSCTAIYFNQEYELNERKRDAELIALCNKQNIAIHSFHDQCLIPPGNILTKQNTPYTVFTPFKKAYYTALGRLDTKFPRLRPQNILKINVPVHKIDPYKKYLDNPILRSWPTGGKAALQYLKNFITEDIANYDQQRDFPALNATSKLSAYLATGVISVRQCYAAAIQHNHQEFASGNAGTVCWISELIWRDFYRQIIWHFPDLCKGYNFNRKYDPLVWESTIPNLSKWQQGQTGIPIVDAAMRQLTTTGWMHNRLRMLVAMFLTKNLLIDWREGERFFAQHLIDFDFASNNGGWQWSASTGTDAVPYFRIFNPITQSQKFDPQGEFIKLYCPELKNLNSKQIHDPSNNLSAAQFAQLNYPPPIVDLNKTRKRAIERFKNL